MNILRTIDSNAVATLTFDRPGSPANLFDLATLDELDTHLAALETTPGLRGVMLRSAKPTIFIAGADLHAFAAGPDPVALGEIVDRGHAVFDHLARLPSPTVAAVHGMCLGGGLELALACDWRAASDADETRLGLPETQLGILPAWGGSVRLPALLGLAAALPLILTGRRLAATSALRAGLVDAVAHPEYLEAAALRLLARGKRPPLPLRLSNRSLFRHLVAWRARVDVLARTWGHYPALLEAVSVATKARGLSAEGGFALEKEALLTLVATPEARNLINLFFLRERAKKSVPAESHPPAGHAPQGVAVIGAGVMGAGIAQWLAAHDRVVRLQEVSPDALARGLQLIEAETEDARRHHRLSAVAARAILDRVTPVPADGPLHDVGWAIEAAVEKLEVKQAIFRRLESRVSAEAILATNTSALSIGALASGLEHPERVVGLHFFNPVARMPLVEIVRGPSTSPAVVDAARRFVLSLDKLPVVARDRPGFLVNRILIPGLVEAVRLFREGLGVREVDRLLLEFGLPMGPLRLADEVGLDIALHVARDLAERLPHLAAPDDTLDRMLAHGWFGKKSGRGFYLHEGRHPGRRPNPELAQLRLEKHGPAAGPAAAADRVVLVMVNEAVRCLDEQVADTSEDIDFAMILGTGWAPFRGGPLRHADALGLAVLAERMQALSGRHGVHLAPCPRLLTMAAAGETFYPALNPRQS